MTDDTIGLSRRNVLAGLGAIGAAGAGAGLGTSALFSDTESFEGNSITAGTLDLKVDWEEHYSYPQLFGFDDPTDGLDVTRTEPSDTSGYVAMPDPQNPAVWVAESDLSAYMDNTSIEAYPDLDDDGIKDEFDTGDVGSACEDGADVPADLSAVDGLRTHNEDTHAHDPKAAKPLVALEDVKPGDFGELTLSFHLCDNPGYIWLAGALEEAKEKGHTEPEADASGENGPADETTTDPSDNDDVELLDAIQTSVWYDSDCDNVFEPGGGGGGGDDKPADVVFVLDRSGSMSGNDMDQAQAGAKSLVDALGPNDQVGLVSFADDVSLDAGLTTNHNSVKNAIDGVTANGRTNMEAGVEQAHEELSTGATFSGSPYSESGNARSNARKIMIFLGDGAENEPTDVTDTTNTNPSKEAQNARNDGIEIFSIAYGNPSGSAKATLKDMASDPQSDHYYEADVSQIEPVLQSIGGNVGSGGEEVIFRGTLRETLQELESGKGIPLDADRSSQGRTCYPGLQTSCVGLSWHLPAGVGNEVQSDVVKFDVGFYAQQCRNNDGTVS